MKTYRDQVIDSLLEGRVTPNEAAKRLVQESALGVIASVVGAYFLADKAVQSIMNKMRGQRAQREFWEKVKDVLPDLEEYKSRLVNTIKDYSRRIPRGPGFDPMSRPQQQVRHRYAADLSDLVDDLQDEIRGYARRQKAVANVLDNYRGMSYHSWAPLPVGKQEVLPPELEKEVRSVVADYLESLKELRGKAKEAQARLLQQAGAAA